jgi:hypothetical protein
MLAFASARSSGSTLARRVAYGAALVALTAGAAISIGGPLAPPAGPISPTYKTLTEVEPRTNIQSLPGNAAALHRITQPGSYYLTGELVVPAGRSGIVVESSGVTIDLNGFRITGQGGSVDGIFAGGATVANLTIRDGSITLMGDDGIDAAVTRVRIENVSSSTNGDAGALTGSTAVLTSVRAQTNGGLGIDAGSNSTLHDCVANDNGGLGMQADASAIVRGCSAINNGGNGIQVGLGSLVVDSTSKDHVPAGANGILAGQGSQVIRSVARNNTAAGIRLEAGASAMDNNVSFNGVGILAFGENCVVERNSISSNTSAGVQMNNSDARVVGNNITDSPTGVNTVGAGGNVIFSNTLSGNGANFALGANDRFGPIQVAAAGVLAVVSPQANIVY